MHVRTATGADHDAVVDLVLRTWPPVFASVNATMGEELALRLHGADWREHQAAEVRTALASMSTWVAEVDGALAGVVCARVVDEDRRIGEVHLLGVAPEAQRQGVGTALTRHAEAWLVEQGMRVSYISTGGDPGHAPARELYADLGYTLFPSAQFFKAL